MDRIIERVSKEVGVELYQVWFTQEDKSPQDWLGNM